MKKFLLSSVVVVGFIAYSISQKFNIKAFIASNPFKSGSNISEILFNGLANLNSHPASSPAPAQKPISEDANSTGSITLAPFPNVSTTQHALSPSPTLKVTTTKSSSTTALKTPTPTPKSTTTKVTATNTPTPTPKSVSTVSSSSPTSTPVPTSFSATPTPTRTPTPTVVPTSVPTSAPAPTATPTPSSGYKDGTYTGSVASTIRGNVQVKATISGGRITSVVFLQAPNSNSTSISINNYADPILCQEAITAQSATVNTVSGATLTSGGFKQSLQYALNLAKA